MGLWRDKNMTKIDDDIASKHDLRTTEGKAAAKKEQTEKDDWQEYGGVLLISVIFISHIGFVIHALSSGEQYLLWDSLPYSEFSWWGWLIYAAGILTGLGALILLFTSFIHHLLATIFGVGIISAGIYYLFS